MKTKRNFLAFFIILSITPALLSCTGEGNGIPDFSSTVNDLNSKVALSTTISGEVKLSTASIWSSMAKPASGKTLQASSEPCFMVGADVNLFDADRPEWFYPVARGTAALDCSYTLNKLTNSQMNLNPDGSRAYNDGNPIPAGNYTVIAKNDITITGSRQYVAVQPYVKHFMGDVTGNDLIAYDSRVVPEVKSMFGLFKNPDGTFGGDTTLVERNRALQVTFTMAMARLSVLNHIGMREIIGNAPVPGTWKVSPDLLSATFYPTTSLTIDSIYEVAVDKEAKNVYGKGLIANVTGTFKAKEDDTTAPNAAFFEPSVQTDVPINTELLFASNEPLDLNTMEISSTPSIGDRPAVIFSGMDNSLVPGKPYIYEVLPNSILALFTDYSITVGGAKDMAGNALTPVTADFKTAQSPTMPEVSGTDPAADATEVDESLPVAAKFTSLMDPETIDGTSFVLNSASGKVAGQVTYNPLTKTAQINPDVNLALDTGYTATVNGTVADLGGNTMGTGYAWSFRTRYVDTTPPTVASTTPVDGQTSVPVDTIINAVFYEAVTGVDATTFKLDSEAGSEAGTVSISPDGLLATFSHGGLSSNTEYTATLTTGIQDTWGNHMASDHVWSFTTIDTIQPDAPVGLVATAISHDRIDMVWGSSTDNIGVTKYNIYRDGTAIDNTTGTFYSDTGGLTHNTLYCYEVTALDAADNESTKSNQSCKSTHYLDTTAPDTPTGVLTNAASPFDIELSWDIPWDDVAVAGYRIYNGTGVLKGTSISNSYTDTSLTHDTIYCYSVSALDASGNESGMSLPQVCERTLYNDITDPDPPSALTATAVSHIQINLAWTASPWDDVGVEEYRIYRNGVAVANTPDIFYYDLGLTNTTSYCYTVSAVDAAGNESTKTSQACDTTLEPEAFVLQLGQTGQTKCFNYSSEISCAGTGQDGDYQAGAPLSFTDNGDDTVTDNLTGLMWQRGGDGSTKIPWTMAEAATFCNGLVHGSASYADWRMPTLKELFSIISYAQYPSIDPAYFLNTVSPGLYLTSDFYAGRTDRVWGVNFFMGSTDTAGAGYVRCVRGNALPAPSYTANGDGTVTDNVTGLMWQQGQSAGIADWQTALTQCNVLTLAEYSDWRLPNVKEIQSIMDITRGSPALDLNYFTAPSAGNPASYFYYFSSTTLDGYLDPRYAAYLSYNGAIDFGYYTKGSPLPVRCVRGGL